MRRNTNFFADMAAGLTAVAHLRAPLVRWGVLLGLIALWLVAGYYGWINQAEATGGDPQEAWYLTFGAIGVQDAYIQPKTWELQAARFAGLAVPVVGLLFAFSGQLGQSLAQLFHMGSANHVVIGGAGPAALSLARDCADRGDVVVVIADGVADETAWSLRKTGVMLVDGDPTVVDTLRTARAHHASHVVALADDDPSNLRIEAAVRAAMGGKRRRRPLAVHVGVRSPALLFEAREMRAADQKMQEARAKETGRPLRPAIDPRPFSLDEIAARQVLLTTLPDVLQMAEQQGHPRLHVVLFGFTPAMEALAARVLMSAWTVRFGAPRITVLTPAPDTHSRLFDARHPHARTHDVWRADIAFRDFDVHARVPDAGFLDALASERGPVSVVAIDTGVEADTIALALALLRAANTPAGEGVMMAAPILIKETSQSEFSKVWAAGDRTPGVLDAYLQAFGAHETVATRRLLVEGVLDAGASMAHRFWQMGVMERGGDASDKELEALKRTWGDTAETYRSANRAVADSAVAKLWDAGLVPASAGEQGSVKQRPTLSPDLELAFAQTEHCRWMAERLMSGWRPGPKRDNAQKIHPNLTPWEALSAEDQAKDVDQVRGAFSIARAIYAQGFTPRSVSRPSAAL